MRYANRMKLMEDKELLSLMELAEAKDMISFSGGFPSPDTYPIEAIRESFMQVLEQDAKGALSYSSTRGYLPLREQIAEKMTKKFNIKASADEIIITNGSQQALDMTGMLLIDKDDVILFETPSYLGALNALKAYEAQLVAVPTDDDGIKIDALKEALDTYGDRIKLVYVIPDFQNPTSRCWSLERRKTFMELMSDYDIPILEDAAYSELSFKSEMEKPLATFDRNGKVIYCGTFSKTFCPGLRVAWIWADSGIIQQFLVLKSGVDLSSTTITQRQMSYYLDHYDLEQHIREIIKMYEGRRDLMMEIISKKFPNTVRYNKPMGGLFLWMALPEGKDSRELLRRAIGEKVSFVPGGSFYPGNAKNNEMRINFSNMTEEEIVEGMTRLGRIATAYLEE